MELFADEKASSVKLLKLLYKNLLVIIVFSILGLVTGIVVTFFIPKKYVSYAVIFPSNSNLGLNVLEDPRFGNSLDADQLMQLLESTQLKDSIINKYDLETYYEVDKSKKSWKQNLEKKFMKDITVNKTRYYSIVIMANMRDADLAANIVNSIIEIVDKLRMQIIKENQLTSFEYAHEQYLKEQVLVDSLKNLIYAKKGTSNPDNILYNHTLDNSKISYHPTKPYVDNIELENLVESYNFELEKLVGLKKDYHKAQRLIEKPLSKVFVVNKAVPRYKKQSPSFLINAIVGLSSAFLFIVLFVVVRNRFSGLRNMLKE